MGLLKLKKGDSGLLRLALLVSQGFIINYYQVMLKLQLNPHDQISESIESYYHRRTS